MSKMTWNHVISDQFAYNIYLDIAMSGPVTIKDMQTPPPLEVAIST